MAARDLMNHDTVPGDITPTERQVISIFRGSALRAKQEQSSQIGLGSVILANRGEYDDIAAHEFRHWSVHKPTKLPTDFPKEDIKPAGYELAPVRGDLIKPAVY